MFNRGTNCNAVYYSAPHPPPPPLTMEGRKKKLIYNTQMTAKIVKQNENKVRQSIPLTISSSEELFQVHAKTFICTSFHFASSCFCRMG